LRAYRRASQHRNTVGGKSRRNFRVRLTPLSRRCPWYISTRASLPVTIRLCCVSIPARFPRTLPRSVYEETSNAVRRVLVSLRHTRARAVLSPRLDYRTVRRDPGGHAHASPRGAGPHACPTGRPL